MFVVLNTISMLPLIWMHKNKTQQPFHIMFSIEKVKSPQIHRLGLKESSLNFRCSILLLTVHKVPKTYLLNHA